MFDYPKCLCTRVKLHFERQQYSPFFFSCTESKIGKTQRDKKIGEREENAIWFYNRPVTLSLLLDGSPRFHFILVKLQADTIWKALYDGSSQDRNKERKISRIHIFLSSLFRSVRPNLMRLFSFLFGAGFFLSHARKKTAENNAFPSLRGFIASETREIARAK